MHVWINPTNGTRAVARPLPIGVRQQVEGERLLGAEILMRFDTVSRHAEDLGAGSLEVAVGIVEIPALGGATGRVILGVEVEDEVLAAELVQ